MALPVTVLAPFGWTVTEWVWEELRSKWVWEEPGEEWVWEESVAEWVWSAVVGGATVVGEDSGKRALERPVVVSSEPGGNTSEVWETEELGRLGEEVESETSVTDEVKEIAGVEEKVVEVISGSTEFYRRTTTTRRNGQNSKVPKKLPWIEQTGSQNRGRSPRITKRLDDKHWCGGGNGGAVG